MTLAIIPQPSEFLVGAVREIAPEATIFAPWALSASTVELLSRLSHFSSASTFLGRRTAPKHWVGLPGWTAVEACLRAWQRGRTDRRYQSMFANRRWVSQLATWLARSMGAQTIIAPSLAALELFAAQPSAKKILIEDLPGLRKLHCDLKRATTAHPNCRFLRRFRASPTVIVRQESEWLLADRVVVRGRFAQKRQQRKAEILAYDVPAAVSAKAVPGNPILLAGLASARHGSCEALQLLEALPDLRLIIRAGEGAEPKPLLDHPRVSLRTSDSLPTVAAVIAPSWVECYPRELRSAAARGIPIIATERASGHIDSSLVQELDVGDVDQLVAATQSIVSATLRPPQLSSAKKASACII